MSCTLSGSPQHSRLVMDVRDRLFRPARPGAPPRFGAEVELLALDADDARPLPILPDRHGPGTLDFLRQYAARAGWTVEPGPHGVPVLLLPGGGTITYEPGGQIEYASPPLDSIAELTADLDRVVRPLVDAARERGLRLLGRGIDPVNPLDQDRLLLAGDRYARMHRYLRGIGRAGPRMMLQTAAIQVNLELGDDPDLRWRTLNALAPHITAIFANSSVYQGRDSGFASFRARQWRLLDRRRTGLLGREQDPAAEYVDFGLGAGWVFGPGDEPAEPFSEPLLRGEVTLDDWRQHLTTLFPEVRPRGFLEVRCIDALPPELYPAPLVFLAGITADRRTTEAAREIAGAPDTALLQVAARHGLRDPGLASAAEELFRLALAAAEASPVVDAASLDVAREYYATYTLRRRSPADDGISAAA